MTSGSPSAGLNTVPPPGGSSLSVASSAASSWAADRPLIGTCAYREAAALRPSGPLSSTVRALSEITMPKTKIAIAIAQNAPTTRPITPRPAVIRGAVRPRLARKRRSPTSSAPLIARAMTRVITSITQ